MKYYFLSLIIIFTLASCNEKEQKEYLCDAETLSSDKQSFVTENCLFKGGKTQTSIDSYKGEFSSIVNVNQNRGIEKEINNLEPGEIITVSVHKKTKSDKGYLVISSGNDNNIVRRERFSYSGKDKNGWEKIEFKIQLPFELSLAPVFIIADMMIVELLAVGVIFTDITSAKFPADAKFDVDSVDALLS